ncbi:MAG: hypothetical protein MUF54_01685, partial [Polyangiaceae bacterium]|nr:hypothetical protein [Polyangiaceae bacterium]
MNKESRSDVLLVFPPCSDAQVLQPYLSLPILARHLKDHGFSVRQADLDLEFFEWVMVPETLRKHREHWERQLKGASNKDSSTIGQLAQMYMQSLFMEENESWLRRKRSHACRMNRLLMD